MVDVERWVIEDITNPNESKYPSLQIDDGKLLGCSYHFLFKLPPPPSRIKRARKRYHRQTVH